MLNQTGITRVAGTTRKTILIAPELAFSLSCMVENTGVTAGDDGRKVVKAGTPVSGNLQERDTAFKVAGEEDTPVGIILHDVDVTKGTANSQVVIFGFVDISKLEEDVAATVKSMEAKLPKITFVK